MVAADCTQAHSIITLKEGKIELVILIGKSMVETQLFVLNLTKLH